MGAGPSPRSAGKILKKSIDWKIFARTSSNKNTGLEKVFGLLKWLLTRIEFDKHSHQKRKTTKIVPSAIPERKASGIRRSENSSLQKKDKQVRAPSPLEVMIAGTNYGHF